MNSLTVLTTFTLLIALQMATIPLASCDKGVGALYFRSNEKDHNAIVVSAIQADGSLTDTKRVEISRAKGAGGIVNLLSSNSIVVFEHFLFNVNYGSNSVTSHKIDAADPTIIEHVGTMFTGGDKPTCLAVSSALNMLCVVNSGEVAKSGVFCLSVESDGKLTANKGVLTSFGTTTNPLPFPPHGWGSPSDVHFTHNDNLSLFLDTSRTFPSTLKVKSERLSSINTFPNGTVPYPMNILNDAGTTIGYTDPGVGQYIIQEFGGDGKRNGSKGAEVYDQANICCSAVSHRSKSLYVIDAADRNGIARVHEFFYETASLDIQLLENIKTTPVLLDLTIVPLASADFMYVIHAEPPPNEGTKDGVFVVKIKGPKNLKEGRHHYPTNVKVTPKHCRNGPQIDQVNESNLLINIILKGETPNA